MSSGRFLDKSLKIDWFFLFLTLCLIVCGVLLVYSATNNEKVVFYETFWFRQIIYFVCGSAIAAGIVFLRLCRLFNPAVCTSTVAIQTFLFLFMMSSAALANFERSASWRG